MQNSNILTLPALFNESLKKHRTKKALGFAGEKAKTYQAAAQDIISTMAFLEKMGVEPGDRVAILSTNMPNWGIVYFAITFMGAIAVPLLPDFHPDEITRILNHSGSKVLFVSESLSKKLNHSHGHALRYQIRIDDMKCIEPEINNIAYTPNENHNNDYSVHPDDPAAIIYTSGTTGKSKGIILSHRNLSFTAIQTKKIQPVISDDRFLSILPLSHTYENTLGFIIPMISGASIYYLHTPPTPGVLLPALKMVKPTIMLSVPMIMEKIYKQKILPALTSKWHMRMIYKFPPARKKLNKLAGRKLIQMFGGELKFFGIGGAKLNPKVEKFLKEAAFPYAIGYGLTETAPLLAGSNPKNTKLQSTGPALEGVQLKINSPNKRNGTGEIWAKGQNIMLGYYKEPELTKQTITDDGWLKTGDLGKFDKDNYLYLKGRLKNMIVGNNGENIYPEEIESMINNFKHVVESLVVEKKGKLVAMVHFNKEEIAQKYHAFKTGMQNYMESRLDELKKELHAYINSKVNRFSKIQYVILEDEPFKKTATQKIKRYLYNRNKN